MPVKFLNKILSIHKLQSRPSKSILEGVYLMGCKDLKNKELLFNDGKPSIILMPNKGDKVKIIQAGVVHEYQSAWLSYGIFSNVYMEVPANLDHLIVIRFNDNAFFNLFRTNPTELLLKSIYNLEELPNSILLQTILDSFRIDNLENRTSYLQEYLSNIEYKEEFPSLLKQIISSIYVNDKNMTVSDLPKLAGRNISDKWIQRSFIKYIGISPKKYLQMHRFIRVHNSLDKLKGKSKLRIALDYGYYDDNHFIKDFKSITGLTPNAYLQEQTVVN